MEATPGSAAVDACVHGHQGRADTGVVYREGVG
jgi:hypothetical protein